MGISIARMDVVTETWCGESPMNNTCNNFFASMHRQRECITKLETIRNNNILWLVVGCCVAGVVCGQREVTNADDTPHNQPNMFWCSRWTHINNLKWRCFVKHIPFVWCKTIGKNYVLWQLAGARGWPESFLPFFNGALIERHEMGIDVHTFPHSEEVQPR